MADPDAQPTLKRAIGLPLLVLYGLGVTIGAGIYVLIGVTAERAGVHAPVAFLVAAAIMVFSAASFAEFSGRFPVSAGEAAYVSAGFRLESAALIVGLMVIAAGTISGATISIGSIGYVREFVDLPPALLVIIVAILMGLIAGAGTMESVGFAAFLTLIELSGLAVILGGGFTADPQLLHKLSTVFPQGFAQEAWAGIFSAGLLAFFAFIGFEDMVNVAEETKNPERNMPLGIFIALGSVALIYFLVSAVAVLNVAPEALAASDAPLGLVFSSVTPLPPHVINLIAIVATLNGVIIQIIMASRVIYGLSERGLLPKVLGRINRRTRTPLLATALVTGAMLILALTFPLDGLAETTSRVTLVIFALVNLALVLLKWRGEAPRTAYFTVPIWVPVAGFLISIAALLPIP